IPQLNLIYVIITPFCIYYYHRMYFYRGGKMGQLETISLVGRVLRGDGDPRYPQTGSVMYVDCAPVQKATKRNIYLLQYWNLYMGEWSKRVSPVLGSPICLVQFEQFSPVYKLFQDNGIALKSMEIF